MAGEPSMDEILASIRKIISEEPNGHRETGANGMDRRGSPPVPPRKDDGAVRPAPYLPLQSDALPAVAPGVPRPGDDLSDLVDQLTSAPSVPMPSPDQPAFPPWGSADSRHAASSPVGVAAGTVMATQAIGASLSAALKTAVAPAPMEFQRAALPPLFGDGTTGVLGGSGIADRVRAVDLAQQVRPVDELARPAFDGPPAQPQAVRDTPPALMKDLARQGDSDVPAPIATLPDNGDAAVSAGATGVDGKPAVETVFSALIAGLVATRGQEAKIEVPVGGLSSASEVAKVPRAPNGEPTTVQPPATTAAAAIMPATIAAKPSGALSGGSVSADVAAEANVVPNAAAVAHIDASKLADVGPSAVAASLQKVTNESALVPQDGTTAESAAGVAKPLEMAAASLAATAMLPSQSVVSAPGGSRTFEDAVAEMLRPMLRQWLDANMPKLVERALASEMATGGPAVGDKAAKTNKI